MKLHNTILYPLLLSTSILSANSLHIESLGVNVGTASIKATQHNTSGTIILPKQPEKSFLSAEVYALVDGIFDDKNKKLTLNYIYSTNSDIAEHNILIGINQYYTYKKYDFYVGGLAGISRLKWKYNPLNNAKDTDYYSTSFTAGLQAGMEYPLTNKLLIGLNTKYLYSRHKANLNPSTGVSANLTHYNFFDFGVGLRYKF